MLVQEGNGISVRGSCYFCKKLRKLITYWDDGLDKPIKVCTSVECRAKVTIRNK